MPQFEDKILLYTIDVLYVFTEEDGAKNGKKQNHDDFISRFITNNDYRILLLLF